MSEQKQLSYEVMEYDFLTFNFCKNWFDKTNKKALFMKGMTPFDISRIDYLYTYCNHEEFPVFLTDKYHDNGGCMMRYKKSADIREMKALYEQLCNEHGLKHPKRLEDTEVPEIQGKFEDVLKEIFKPNQEGCKDPFDNLRKHKDVFLEPLKKQRTLLFTFDQEALKDTSFEWLLSGTPLTDYIVEDWFRAYYAMLESTLGLQVIVAFGYCIVYRKRDDEYAVDRLQFVCEQLNIGKENPDERKVLHVCVKYMNWVKNSGRYFDEVFTEEERKVITERKIYWG